jgi:hypothetical protein
MQRGSLIRKNHKQGPDVWQFRWSEKSPEGRRVYRKRVIGTVEQYPLKMLPAAQSLGWSRKSIRAIGGCYPIQ